MRPELLNALLKLAQDALNGNQIEFDMHLLDSKNQDKICLTLKNYKMLKGVSTQIHGVVPVLDPPEEDDICKFDDEGTQSHDLDGSGDFNSPDKISKECRRMHWQGHTAKSSVKVYLPSEAAGMAQTVSAVTTEAAFDLKRGDAANAVTGQMRPVEEMFNIKGPMGRGLEIKPHGLHVAFCAGTGVLVFLDLVAHLLMRNVFQSRLPEDKVEPQFLRLKEDFEFHLYVAFTDADQTIGLELCEALERINVKFHYKNFKLTVRLSEDIYAKKKPPRWNEEFIEGELTPHAGKMQKVWVCGPPILNQTFDIALGKLKQKLKLGAEQIDIL